MTYWVSADCPREPDEFGIASTVCVLVVYTYVKKNCLRFSHKSCFSRLLEIFIKYCKIWLDTHPILTLILDERDLVKKERKRREAGNVVGAPAVTDKGELVVYSCVRFQCTLELSSPIGHVTPDDDPDQGLSTFIRLAVLHCLVYCRSTSTNISSDNLNKLLGNTIRTGLINL